MIKWYVNLIFGMGGVTGAMALGAGYLYSFGVGLTLFLIWTAIDVAVFIIILCIAFGRKS